MRKITITCLVLIFCIHTQSQDKIPPSDIQTKIKYHLAKRLITGQNSEVNFERAFSLFQSCASAGHAPSMNALAIMHKDGLGCDKDLATAAEWFNKAAQAGYQKANYNLGLMFRYGNGVQQNDTIAYQHFLAAARGGFAGGMYGVGYMRYTGQGVEQSYPDAIEWLKKGSEIGRPSCMYLLGLCYRNGYGINKDIDTAREWMLKAADLGYNFAEDELYTPQAENNMAENAGNLKSAKAKKAAEPMESGEKIHDVEVHGRWQGVKTTYDFSGKHKLRQEPIVLNLVQNGKHVTGKWTENDSTTFDIEGTLAHNALYFVKGQTQRSDRYKHRRNWKLQQGQLQAVLLNDELYLTCKLREYSPDIMELGQPISLKFAKSKHFTGKIDSIRPADLTPLLVIHTPEQTGLGLTLHATKDSKDAGTETTAPRHKVTASQSTDDAWPGIPEAGISLTPYPNPFSEHLSIAYTLPINGKVSMALYDMQGRAVQYILQAYQQSGQYTEQVNCKLPPGAYLLSIAVGNERQSTIVIKTHK